MNSFSPSPSLPHPQNKLLWASAVLLLFSRSLSLFPHQLAVACGSRLEPFISSRLSLEVARRGSFVQISRNKRWSSVWHSIVVCVCVFCAWKFAVFAVDLCAVCVLSSGKTKKKISVVVVVSRTGGSDKIRQDHRPDRGLVPDAAPASVGRCGWTWLKVKNPTAIKRFVGHRRKRRPSQGKLSTKELNQLSARVSSELQIVVITSSIYLLKSSLQQTWVESRTWRWRCVGPVVFLVWTGVKFYQSGLERGWTNRIKVTHLRASRPISV